MQSHSEENYLKTIYLLSRKEGGKVRVTALAAALGNNAASVIDMLKKLTEKKLVAYDKIKGARLSEAGQKAALQTIRRHRLWELFLQTKLGYTWDEVHEIAEQLEHVQDEQLADKLDEFLGYPKYDPHGESIPKSNGRISELRTRTLMEIIPGKSCKVVAVRDTSKSFLQYLVRLNIGIGAILKVVEKIDYDSSLVVLINNSNTTTISAKLAESIFVN